MSETLDSFLGGRVKLVQPSEGYRAGIDPIFLAACINPKPQEKILDVGAGVGTASFALVVRCPHAKVTGLEIQADLVELAVTNIKTNQLTDRVEIIKGDLLSPPPVLKPHSFDQVITNPPYYEYSRTQSSPIPGKAQANTETIDLGKWLKCCLKMLKPKGTFTMIHRAERLSEILSHLDSKVGNLIIYPLWAGPRKPARRVIIQGRKNMGGEPRLAFGMMLHGGGEKYTPEAEEILRSAQPLVL
ncbi:MAG: methyltransferase [Proteobacteria bacterium]|nr:methyltransferase [Pseudomonadota bacterium]